jgi:2,3-bisphosphoglycerate-dependent phosphoglycerate mutase
MKIILFVFCAAFLVASSAGNAHAQSGEITYILLRHAEKDASPTMNKADVDLSAEGKQRAARLVDVVKSYQPEQIFATIFRRARLTVTPLAETLKPDYRLMIQTYDHTGIKEFAERLLKLNAKTVIVSGHNTTTPELANFLINQQKYKALDESEYNKIWIIKIKRSRNKPNKVIEDKVITY